MINKSLEEVEYRHQGELPDILYLYYLHSKRVYIIKAFFACS